MGRKGYGTIRRTKTGWQALFHENYKQYSAGVHPTYEDARRALTKAQREMDLGLNLAVQRAVNPTVADVLEDWVKANRQGWTFNGLRTYEDSSRHINRCLGSIRLRDLKRADVEQRLRDALLTHLSPKSGRNVIGTLNTAIRWHLGLENPVILRNPAERVKVSVPRYEWRWLTPAQAHQLTDVLVRCPDERQPYANFFGMALETLRRCESELCALRASDVDLMARTYRVEQVMLHRHIVPAGDPASGRKHKRRQYDLSEGAAWYIERQMAWLRRQAVPADLGGSHLLFTDEMGQPFATSTLTREFRRFLEEAGLPRIRIHDLRHTGASLLFAQGESIATVQEIGGWASKMVLLEIYSHVMPGTAKAAVDRLSKGLRQAP